MTPPRCWPHRHSPTSTPSGPRRSGGAHAHCGCGRSTHGHRRAQRVGDLVTAVEVAEVAFALDPLRESVTRSLMAWHVRAGRRGEALRAYQRLRNVLADELGVDPSPETEAVYLEVLGHRAAEPVERVALPPALRPRDDTPFVGRDDELRGLLEWSSLRGGARLLVVEGEPGIGKSRLIREAARTWHAEGIDVIHAQFEEHRPDSLAPLAALLDGDEARTSLVDRLRPSGDRRSDPSADVEGGDRELVLDEAADALVERSRRGRLVVVLDDTQWAGAAAMSVATRLVARPGVDVHVVAIHAAGGRGPSVVRAARRGGRPRRLAHPDRAAPVSTRTRPPRCSRRRPRTRSTTRPVAS
ncbi:MAG: AAA family ATPase [Microthrixaceae bacterium]